jgi:hypothetical protein
MGFIRLFYLAIPFGLLGLLFGFGWVHTRHLQLEDGTFAPCIGNAYPLKPGIETAWSKRR